MKITIHKNRSGFTLIEVLIVAAMLGIVMGAIYSLYVTHQRTAYTQEEVVDVQQNLRIAMDSISRDIRMSGFLIPKDANPRAPNPPPAPPGNDQTMPVGNYGSSSGIVQPLPAPDDIASDIIILNMASPSAGIGRIDQADTGVIVTAGTEIFFTVAENAYFFSVEDPRQVVRIIRPIDRSQPINTTFTVEGVGTVAASCGGVVPPCLKLRSTGGTGSTVGFRRGDMVVRTGTTASETYPGRVEYSLVTGGGCTSGQYCIQRSVNGTAAIIANNIAGLQFRYQTDSVAVPETDAPTDLRRIRAVRVTIIGQTYSTKALSGNQAMVRTLTSVVGLRNREE